MHHHMVYGHNPARCVWSVTEDLCITRRGCVKGVVLPDVQWWPCDVATLEACACCDCVHDTLTVP